MDDLSSKLQGILSDPNSMEQIKQMAQGLLGGTTPAAAPATSAPPSLDSLLGDAQNMGKIMKIMSALQNQPNDNRTQLLMALKPHLSPERAKRVDSAVKLLRLASIAPALADSGILF